MSVIAASRDNTLYERADGGRSNGLGRHFFAGRLGPNGSMLLRRALVHFDVARELPAGSRIVRARLELNLSKQTEAGRRVSIHRALANWGEGDSRDQSAGAMGNTPAARGDATWLHRFFDGELWDSPGGDFAADATAVSRTPDEGLVTWGSNESVVADVQGWLDKPAENFGWVIVGDESVSRSAKRFDSKDHPDERVRPRLLVEYEAAQPTPTATRPRATPTPFPTLTPGGPCAGDCDGDGVVAIVELVLGIDIALGGRALDACDAIDADLDDRVEIFELVAAVDNAVGRCPSLR